MVNTAQESIVEFCLFVHPYFPSNDQFVLLILFGWFVRWEVNVCAATVKYGANLNYLLRKARYIFVSSFFFFLFFVFFSQFFIRTQEVLPYCRTTWPQLGKFLYVCLLTSLWHFQYNHQIRLASLCVYVLCIPSNKDHLIWLTCLAIL